MYGPGGARLLLLGMVTLRLVPLGFRVKDSVLSRWLWLNAWVTAESWISVTFLMDAASGELTVTAWP
jgi:hypothetical protein